MKRGRHVSNTTTATALHETVKLVCSGHTTKPKTAHSAVRRAFIYIIISSTSGCIHMYIVYY